MFADFILDDMIVDIKTVSTIDLKRDYINQLIGYYALHRIAGIEGYPKKRKINRLGIYYSRFGLLICMRIHNIIDENKFQKFLKWFSERAAAHTGMEIFNKKKARING